MPRFLVTLCRTAYEYADVTIEAVDADAAEVVAVALANAKKVPNWEPTYGDEGPADAVNVEDLL